MARGGRRPGAGRKKKVIVQPQPQPQTIPVIETKTDAVPVAQPSLEGDILNLLARQKAGTVTPEEFKKALHELAYLRQEVDFIKKIILASVGESLK